MPSPQSAAALTNYTLSAALGEFWEFAYDDYQFIGQDVFPTANVMKQSGPFGKLEIEEMLKEEVHLARAPGTAYSRDRVQFATDTYACVEYGREEKVDVNEANMYADYFSDPYGFATQRATHVIQRGRERRIASQVFNTTTFAVGTFGMNPTNGVWSLATATPAADVEAAAQKVFDNSGMWPNAVIMNRKAFRNARKTNEIKDEIASSGAGDSSVAGRVTAQQLAEVFDIPQVLVGGGARNTAAADQPAAIEQVWGNHCMVARIARSEDMKEPCLGRSMHWPEDGSLPDGIVEQYPEPQTRSEIIRVRHQMDEKLLLVNCGVLIHNVL